MTMKQLGQVLFLVATGALIVACGGGGGGGGGGTVLRHVTVTAANPVMLVDKSTTIFANFSGTTVVPGTQVTFTSTFTPTNKADTSLAGVGAGVATVQNNKQAQIDLTHVTGSNSEGGKAQIKASVAGYLGSVSVKIIPVPDKIFVSVALNKAVSNMGSLQFNVVGNAAYPVPAPNQPSLSGDLAGRTTTSALANTIGATTIANYADGSSAFSITRPRVPFTTITFDKASNPVSNPSFSIDETAGTIIATDFTDVSSKGLTAADFVLTTRYCKADGVTCY